MLRHSAFTIFAVLLLAVSLTEAQMPPMMPQQQQMPGMQQAAGVLRSTGRAAMDPSGRPASTLMTGMGGPMARQLAGSQGFQAAEGLAVAAARHSPQVKMARGAYRMASSASQGMMGGK